jgi:uncharacterized protein (UPF0335 family)
MESISSAKLRQYITELEALEDKKADIAEEMRQIWAHAKADGLDPKILRQVLKIRKMKPEEVSEQEELLTIYLNALG